MSNEARGALAISGGQAALMLSGGVLALLITQFFGKGAGTDAFFTAYGFYVIAVALAQTLRLTALPRLMGDVTGEQESRLVAAAVAMAAAAAVPMLALAGPLGRLIANGDPSGVAAETLRMLWPALALHLLAGVLVPMLALRGIYTSIGLAFVLASIAGVLSFLLLQPEFGLQAVSLGLAISAALLAFSLVLTLHREGWRLRWQVFTAPRRIAGDCWFLTISSASFLIVNVGYLVCLAIANHEPRGSATTYAYAFFAGAFFVSVTAIPGAMVRAPRLLDSGGDSGVTSTDVTNDFRMALMLLTPAFGLSALVATPLTELIAGSFFDRDDTRRLVEVLMALAPWVLSMVAAVLVVLELLNRGRMSTLAWLAATQCAALIPLAIAGRLAGGIVGIAAAQSLTMCVATAVQLRLAFKPHGGAAIAALLRVAIRATAFGALAFGPATALLVFVENDQMTLLASVVGLFLYAAIAKSGYPREWRLLRNAIGLRSA